MRKVGLAVLLLTVLSTQMARAQIVSREVEYKDGDTVLQGYLAYDDSRTGRRPAVIVVHEWQGLNAYAKMRVEQLAGLGYAGFALDLYGKDIRPESHEEAAKISGLYRADRILMRRRAKAGYDFLRAQPNVDPARIAAIGYCFGGTAVLEMARAGWPLAGVATFHGFLGTPLPAKKGDIQAAVRIFHGDEDTFTEPELERFRREMREAEVADWQVIVLSGAVHRFSVPSAGSDKTTGMAYNERADKASWEMLVEFLKEVFR